MPGKTILITGGAGFIGSHYARQRLRNHPDNRVVNLDKLTYAGNAANITDLAAEPRHTFVQGDIKDYTLIRQLIDTHGVSRIVNFAAETHVDNSISGPRVFLETNVLATQQLLHAAHDANIERFLQVSTDEVYGSITQGEATEEWPLLPNSPYAVSKASADLLVRAYAQTFGLRALITRSSNNFGPNQHPEKLIPLFVTNLIEGKTVPVYGSGKNVRDWIHVEDNCRGIDLVLEQGAIGSTYNIGGGNPKSNLEVTQSILNALNAGPERIQHVTDRPGHDLRYAIDCSKAHALGWQPRHDFESALTMTIQWYAQNPQWWAPLKKKRGLATP